MLRRCSGLIGYATYRYGGRYLYTWIGLTIYAFIFEYLPLSVPDLNVFWHARGVLSFFGMRVPLYALFGIHQTFGYIAYVLVKRLRLPWWAEGPGVGVTSVMLLLPYRLVGTKLLWWTWHDTDPTLSDRMFWTPWFWFYFYAACMCSFVWVLHFSRCILLEEEYDWKKCPREIFCPLLAGVLSYWLANIQVSILYCPLHDIFGVHSEIITILLLSCYSLVVVITDRKNLVAEARKASRFWFDELSCAIVLEYTFLLLLVLIAEPSSIVSEVTILTFHEIFARNNEWVVKNFEFGSMITISYIDIFFCTWMTKLNYGRNKIDTYLFVMESIQGIHQPIGPCEEMENISTHSSVFEREKYLCATNYDEKYFDFHCVPNGVPKEHHDIYEKTALEYYTVCGTEFDNRAEYVIVIGGCCFLFGLILHQMAACSGSTPLFPIKSRKHIAGNTTSFRDNTIRNQETKQTRHEVQPTEHDDTMTSSQCLIPESIEADVGIRRKHTKPTNASKVGKALSRRKSTEMRSSARVLRSYSHM
ncbi:hypothetical protein DICVIV_10472 [Dictyocaulus viviparus]|uniref:DUF7802 domain-containing protein n=1 Tax=Dictyocaulus viviparus TaxID=29172 RepID=A0A0D8XFR0_DICVI|nr:hypothetical protein DICVIV_10472 [Dictyocaulus viviparus]